MAEAKLEHETVEIRVKALLDTGAGPNVMTEGTWKKLGKPEL